MSKSKLIWLAIILIFAAGIFGSLLLTPQLTWDDDTNIFANVYYQGGEWMRLWREPYFGMYVPVTSTVWAALYSLGDGATWPFRALNLILHLINIALVYALLNTARKKWKLNDYAVLMGTAIFALHPLQVHTIAWISGGRDLLAATFSLAAVAVYYHRSARQSFALATAFFLLALLSKPSTAILPAVVLLLDWIINDKPQHHSLIKMGLWGFFSVAAIVLTRQAQDDFIPNQLSLLQHILVVFDSYGFYLQKFLYPLPLSANYARTPESALQDSTAIWSAIVATAALAGYALLAWRTDRRYALIYTWFLALLPVSGIIAFGFQRISTVSDHYNYLPMAGLAAFVVFVLSRLNWQLVPRIVPALLTAAMISAFSAMSLARTQVWRSDTAFYTDMARTAPESYATALGMSIVMCEDLKQFEEGVKWTEIALKDRPDDILALANQAYCFLHAKNYFRVIELEHYLGKLDLDDLEVKQPTAYSSMLASIGTAYIEQKEYGDGFQFLCEAYRVKPSEPGHARNLEIAANILRQQGLTPECETESGDDIENGADPDGAPEAVWPDAPQEPDDSSEEE